MNYEIMVRESEAGVIKQWSGRTLSGTLAGASLDFPIRY